MCLINELARFNRLVHQYRLTDETGPAHKRTFTVCLKLGGEGSANTAQGQEEEYLASGPSIKKAQHAAAAIAMEKTKLKHPPPKQKQTKNSEILNYTLLLLSVCLSDRSHPKRFLCCFHLRNFVFVFLFQPTSLPPWS